MALSKIRKSFFAAKDAFDFSDGKRVLLPDDPPPLPRQAGHLTRNRTEKRRLQGLMREPMVVDGDGTGRFLTAAQQWKVWMVNEGQRRLFYAVWILLHVLVFGFGFVNLSGQFDDRMPCSLKFVEGQRQFDAGSSHFWHYLSVRN